MKNNYDNSKFIQIEKGNKVLELNLEYDANIYLILSNKCSLDIKISMFTEGINVHIYGIVLGSKKSNISLTTTSEHLVPNCNSRVLIKGVFAQGAVFNYLGMIKIAKNAQLSDAYLKNENLLIGDADVNSSPQLEILADDVKASHGVTISSYDEAQKFYLSSRGLDNHTAESLLIESFFSDIVEVNRVKAFPKLLKGKFYDINK